MDKRKPVRRTTGARTAWEPRVPVYIFPDADGAEDWLKGMPTDHQKRRGDAKGGQAVVLSFDKHTLKRLADICHAVDRAPKVLRALERRLVAAFDAYFNQLVHLDIDPNPDIMRRRLLALRSGLVTFHESLTQLNDGTQRALAEEGFARSAMKDIIYVALMAGSRSDETADGAEFAAYWHSTDPEMKLRLSPGKLGAFERAFSPDYGRGFAALAILLDSLNSASAAALSRLRTTGGASTKKARRLLAGKLVDVFYRFMCEAAESDPTTFDPGDDEYGAKCWKGMSFEEREKTAGNWVRVAARQAPKFLRVALESMGMKMASTTIDRVVEAGRRGFPLPISKTK